MTNKNEDIEGVIVHLLIISMGVFMMLILSLWQFKGTPIKQQKRTNVQQVLDTIQQIKEK